MMYTLHLNMHNDNAIVSVLQHILCILYEIFLDSSFVIASSTYIYILGVRMRIMPRARCIQCTCKIKYYG